MRVLFAAFLLISACLAQTPVDRLAGAAKLWAHIKYFHPKVTSPDMDWDAAFATAAPRMVGARTNEEAAEAVEHMLAVLNDPATRLLGSSESEGGAFTWSIVEQDDVTIASLTPASLEESMRQESIAQRLVGAGKVVFDLRNARSIPMGYFLPIAKAVTGPAYLFRVHSGYASPQMIASGGFYRSSWERQDGVRIQAAAKTIRPVFLVNSKTQIPTIALAVQDSSEGAIVSEDEVNDSQIITPSILTLWKGQQAAVRWGELQFPDGTTGLTVNRVLNKTGDGALAEAVQIAKSGKWPARRPRLKTLLAPAAFREKTDPAPYPDEGMRYVAAARIWAVFSYFHPYKHLYDRDWDRDVLPEYLVKLAAARDAREFHLAVAEMVSHTVDTHDFVSSPEISSAFGMAPPPVLVRWIENKPVVTRVAKAPAAGRLEVGDVISKIDGKPVQERIDFIRKHTAHSTEQSAMYRAMVTLLLGERDSALRVTAIGADGMEREAELQRIPVSDLYYPDGETIRLLSPEIGYVDLTRLENAQVDGMFEQFKDTQTIIMDMRGYPRGTAWSIAPRLATQQGMIAAQFRRNLVRATPGEDSKSSIYFEQRIPETTKPRYAGKTILLIDERAISQSEHSGLFYKTANGTTFIGSPTTGANGDVTHFFAPGNIRIGFSGHDVRWPDGRQLQRVGLQPDIEVRPTIAGIRAGRDEVLERAVEFAKTGK